MQVTRVPHYDLHRNLLFGIVVVSDEQNLERQAVSSQEVKELDSSPRIKHFQDKVRRKPTRVRTA